MNERYNEEIDFGENRCNQVDTLLTKEYKNENDYAFIKDMKKRIDSRSDDKIFILDYYVLLFQFEGTDEFFDKDTLADKTYDDVYRFIHKND